MGTAIGIVIYKNSREELFSCLESIKNQSQFKDISVVAFYDANNGTNKEIAYSLFKELDIENSKVLYLHGDNIGFGGGHNYIFNQLNDMKYEFDSYLCLNPDAIMHPNCLNELRKFAEKHAWQGAFEAIQFPVPHPKKYDPMSGVTAWCSGCCLLFSKELYMQLSGFDESFFLYCEDVDISWRAKALGFPCYTVKNALISHFAIERDDDHFRLRWMFLSGVILGYKWRAKRFTVTMLKNLKERYDMEIDIEDYCKEVQCTPIKEIMKAAPDFNNGFSFAETYWR